MTIRPIDVGEEPNDETGDTLRDGGIIINENFAELDQRTAAAQASANSKEPAIAAGGAGQYWTGQKAWADLGTAVRGAVLTGLSLATGTVIAATDSLLVALGKLQKQVTDLGSTKANKGANSDITSLSGMTTALSVAQGGTGGNTQASARAGLGLGTAATATITTADADATAGRALKVGDFGVGSLFMPLITNMNAIPVSGNYRFASNVVNGPPDVGFGTLLHGTYDSATTNFTQLILQTGGAKAWWRGAVNGSIQPWREIYHTGNTTRGTNGALSAASPIVRIADVVNSERGDLLEHTFEEAGPWGVGNDQARGVIVDRVAVGVYVITGSLGLALEGWRIHDPSSPDGGRMLGITESEQDEQGAVTVRLFKQRWTLDDDGEMHLGKGAPLDVPLNSWIDVRLEMPKQGTPVPPLDAVV
ncbi:pyocin knob domain-containing protein [Pseudomonas piscis]|uniref:pyocin knob domain-containing protein n=1 Tax=Pseudomonas piscis TaxID=2614538 RepID=UPI0021D5D2D6|nr:hypothetical protein [Pseudomonas piscis]MCU7645660.1 hypothetical protein [Pseudomonas piscis]